MNARPPSLKRALIVKPMLIQFATLTMMLSVILLVFMRMSSNVAYTEETITGVIAQSIVRHADGRMTLRPTPELAQLRAETPDLWFVAEDDRGRNVTLGQVPPPYAHFGGALHRLSYMQIRDRAPPYGLSAVIRQEVSPAGKLTILAHGKLTELTVSILVASNLFSILVIVLLALVSLVVTPWIVRRSLAGVNRIAEEAGRIDAHRRGWRLGEDQVPIEILPLVRAVNEVLRRLDEGYERQRRFIASAAHELRTPIAILRIKVDGAEEAATRNLGNDVHRLANLAEQLLDLQRLDVVREQADVDLVSLVRRVAAELAPVLIAADRTIEVVVVEPRTICGDAGPIERVLTNLVQNAIEHGGRHVIVRVLGHGFEVEDDGIGIPIEERERVFEPFHRLRPRSTGAGLGLNLVRQVVELHGGRVALLAAPVNGTVVRVEFLDP